jgi:poly(3-hydroxybutyrate) depolymerase
MTLCTVDGGIHAWPGGPSEPAAAVATDLIWDFFVAHPMPARDGG